MKNTLLNKCLCLLVGLVIGLPLAGATVFVDQDQRTYEGEVLDDDGAYIYLDTKNGVINIEKKRLRTMDGEPYAGASLDPTKPTRRSASGGSSKVSNLAIEVGSGGLTQTELGYYKRGVRTSARHKKVSGMDWGTENKMVIQAIEDEIVFQAALDAGYHKRDDIKPRIIEQYEANQTLKGVEPSAFPDQEMRDYYERNKSEFMFPAEYKFKMIQDMKIDRKTLDTARDYPEDVTGWKGTGWVKEGDTFYLPLTEAQLKKIYSLRQGQVSDVIRGSISGEYLFWCTDYKAPRQKTYAQAKERVRHLLIGVKQGKNKTDLQKKVSPADTSSAAYKQGLFDQAIADGKLRDRFIRSRIINTYINDNGGDMGQVVRKVQARYPVKIHSN